MATKGKATFYPSKIQQPVTTNFTRPSRDAMDAYEAISGASRSDLLEHVIRKFAGLPLNETLERMLAGQAATVDVEPAATVPQSATA
jgi:hypothetical protein